MVSVVCDKISETNQEHASAGLGQMNVFVKTDVNPTAGIQNIFLFFSGATVNVCWGHPKRFLCLELQWDALCHILGQTCQGDKSLHGPQIQILIITSIT